MPETILHFASSLEAGFAAVGQPALRVALTSGGDERLAIDPRTGRNCHGMLAGPAPEEISFASSAASPISPRGHAAAESAFARLLTGGPRAGVEWTQAIRTRLLRLYGVPGAEAILAASGTEAEFVALTLARTLLARPITTIVPAAGETGGGIRLAAAGCHVLASTALGARVEPGTHLSGLVAADVGVVEIAVRAADGAARGFAAVDRMVLAQAQAALSADRDVLVHCLDTSETGLAGFSRSTAEALQASADGRCVVVVDARQLRCSAATIRRDLAAGFLVMIAGSTFAGGPAFSGAVLVPPALADRLGRVAPPPGLGACSARNDWPGRLHAQLEPVLPTTLNIGLGLRWEAALAELEALEALDPDLRGAIVARFGALVEHHVAAADGLTLVDGGEAAPDRPRTIVPILTHDGDGAALCARALQRAMMTSMETEGPARRIVHLGRPVDIGRAAALPVALSAPQICAVAARAATSSLEEAMAPLAGDLDVLFAKWLILRGAAIRAAARTPLSA